jgi:hypothetical protein
MTPILRILAPFLALLSATPLAAHEFWISPQAYRIAPGEAILADVRVGQDFSGITYAFMPPNFDRFDQLTSAGQMPVPGRIGDKPAVTSPNAPEGLAILIHESTDAELTYRDFTKFIAFAEHKDFTWAVEEHAARGLPVFNFRETYRRHAKALIGVGDGAGADTRTGMDFELVALANPYTDDLSSGMPVQLWKGDAPLADTQIELFAKDAAGEVTITKHRTDASGTALLPMLPDTEYLVDAVILEPRTAIDTTKDEVWHSDWAALTFKTGPAL